MLCDLGFDQIVAWSLVDGGLADRLRLAADDRRRDAVAPLNPISTDHELLRTTLLGGLLDAARRNVAHGAERLALFESGRVYEREPAPAEGGALAGAFAGRTPAPVREPHRLAGLLAGDLRPRSWRPAAPDSEAEAFFALKGALELLAEQLASPVGFEAAPEPFLHPGRAATITVAAGRIGWIGELHPLVARGWDLPPAAAFELDLAPLVAASSAGAERYRDLTTFPAVLQDLAVVVPDDVSAERVREAVHAGGGELLVATDVFDVYRGEQVGPGERSLALRLEFRARDRTLTDAEVGELRARIADSLGEIGGTAS